MNYSQYTLSPREKKDYYVVSSLLLGLAGCLFYRHWAAAAFLLLLAPMGEKGYCKYLAKKRVLALSNEFRDFLYSVDASLCGGRQMEEAILEAEKNLSASQSDMAVISEELKFMSIRIRESNESAETILKDFAQRSGVSDIQQFAEVYCVCKTTGGDLQQVIQKTVKILVEKINFRYEVRSVTAQKRTEINVLTAIAVGMIALLNVISPDYLQVLYTTFQGRLVMTAALGGIAAAYGWSMKLTEIQLD